MEANKISADEQFPKDANVNFCVGKEWYRFPNSYFFSSNKWVLLVDVTSLTKKINLVNVSAGICSTWSPNSEVNCPRLFRITKMRRALFQPTSMISIEKNRLDMYDNFTFFFNSESAMTNRFNSFSDWRGKMPFHFGFGYGRWNFAGTKLFSSSREFQRCEVFYIFGRCQVISSRSMICGRRSADKIMIHCLLQLAPDFPSVLHSIFIGTVL